jgi:hypothetical protein
MPAKFSVPKFLWGEAVQTAAHIRNLVPKTGQTLTPYELMFDKKPSVDHLRVFGCTAHAHIPKEQRKKTDPVSATGMFVGYAQFSKAWRVLIWRAGKLTIIESASVKFDENSSPSIKEMNKALIVPVNDAPLPDEDDDFFFMGLVPIPAAEHQLPAIQNPQSPADTDALEGGATEGIMQKMLNNNKVRTTVLFTAMRQ